MYNQSYHSTIQCRVLFLKFICITLFCYRLLIFRQGIVCERTIFIGFSLVPAIWRKWTHPALTPARRRYSIYLPRRDGRLSWARSVLCIWQGWCIFCHSQSILISSTSVSVAVTWPISSVITRPADKCRRCRLPVSACLPSVTTSFQVYTRFFFQLFSHRLITVSLATSFCLQLPSFSHCDCSLT